jgi:small subunit ribosomal protein S9
MKIARLPASLREGLRWACSARPIPSHPIIRQRGSLNLSIKRFSTSNELVESNAALTAAPEIKFKEQGEEGMDEGNEEKVFFARLKPVSPSYFSAKPLFTDDLLMMQALAYKHASLPRVKPADAPRVAWGSHIDYKNVTGEDIQPSKYKKIVDILASFNRIHPALVPKDVEEVLTRYKRAINPYSNQAKPPFLNEGGISTGAGRRKTSYATAMLIEGTGEVYINGKTLVEAFGRYHDRESAIWALKATDRVDKYNVWAKVRGGGTTGQAEALTLAVAKALMGHEPALKPALRRGKFTFSYRSATGVFFPEKRCTDIFIAGCVTRDPRRVERKKPGHVKARKMPAWVKR